MDCSPPGSSVRGILQARILAWVAMPSSRGSSRPRYEPGPPALQAESLPSEPPGKKLECQVFGMQTQKCQGQIAKRIRLGANQHGPTDRKTVPPLSENQHTHWWNLSPEQRPSPCWHASFCTLKNDWWKHICDIRAYLQHSWDESLFPPAVVWVCDSGRLNRDVEGQHVFTKSQQQSCQDVQRMLPGAASAGEPRGLPGSALWGPKGTEGLHHVGLERWVPAC